MSDNLTPPILPGDPGHGAEPQPPALPKSWYKRWWVIALGAVVFLGVISSLNSDTDPDNLAAAATATTTLQPTTSTEVPQVTSTIAETTSSEATSTSSRPPTTTTTAPTTTTTEAPVIGSGVYIGGSEFAAGLYRVIGYWARLDSDQEIIDNDIVYDNGMTLLNVRESDSFIEISGEAIAVADFNGGSADPLVLGWTEGTYLVGIDVQPGQYRITPIESIAYFARLDADGEIIDNNLSEGQLIAQVSASDWAFQFTGTLEPIEG
jgi:hypothetical protein